MRDLAESSDIAETPGFCKLPRKAKGRTIAVYTVYKCRIARILLVEDRQFQKMESFKDIMVMGKGLTWSAN